MMTKENQVYRARPSSSFESYQPFTATQFEAWKIVLDITHQLLDHESEVLGNELPFKKAKLIIISGKPGTGKSHLLEAIVNHIFKINPELLNRLYFSKSNFVHDNMIFGCDYDDKPIVLIDDIFAEYHHVDDLHPRTDIAALFNFLRKTYEKRRLVIATSNFSFIDSIEPMMNNIDETGRFMSRLQEIKGQFGEIGLDGPDYRSFSTMEEYIEPFSLF